MYLLLSEIIFITTNLLFLLNIENIPDITPILP